MNQKTEEKNETTLLKIYKQKKDESPKETQADKEEEKEEKEDEDEECIDENKQKENMIIIDFSDIKIEDKMLINDISFSINDKINFLYIKLDNIKKFIKVKNINKFLKIKFLINILRKNIDIYTEYNSIYSLILSTTKKFFIHNNIEYEKSLYDYDIIKDGTIIYNKIIYKDKEKTCMFYDIKKTYDISDIYVNKMLMVYVIKTSRFVSFDKLFIFNVPINTMFTEVIKKVLLHLNSVIMFQNNIREDMIVSFKQSNYIPINIVDFFDQYNFMDNIKNIVTKKIEPKDVSIPFFLIITDKK